MSNKILSVISIIAAAGAIPTELDLFNNAIKAILALAVTVIAYFLKELVRVNKENQKQLKRQDLVLRRHSIMFKYWLQQAQVEIEHGGGRRKSDIALVNLLQAISDSPEDLEAEEQED